jgi:hypothetical protein
MLGVSEAEEHREQVTRGWIDVWLRADGVWGVSWEPYEGDPDYPGASYTPADALRPDDFPTEFDPERLLEWARRRWSGPPPAPR